MRYVDVPGPRVRRGFGEIAHLVLRRRRHQAREVRGRAGAQRVAQRRAQLYTEFLYIVKTMASLNTSV